MKSSHPSFPCHRLATVGRQPAPISLTATIVQPANQEPSLLSGQIYYPGTPKQKPTFNQAKPKHGLLIQNP